MRTEHAKIDDPTIMLQASMANFYGEFNQLRVAVTALTERVSKLEKRMPAIIYDSKVHLELRDIQSCYAALNEAAGEMLASRNKMEREVSRLRNVVSDVKVELDNLSLRGGRISLWRAQGVTFRECGERLGISGTRARQIFLAYCKRPDL